MFMKSPLLPLTIQCLSPYVIHSNAGCHDKQNDLTINSRCLMAISFQGYPM